MELKQRHLGSGRQIPDRKAVARDIPRDDSVVTLCLDWTTAVDRKCGS